MFREDLINTKKEGEREWGGGDKGTEEQRKEDFAKRTKQVITEREKETKVTKTLMTLT